MRLGRPTFQKNPSSPSAKTSVFAIVLLALAASLFLSAGAVAGILNSQEQAMANLLVNNAGQTRDRSAMLLDATLSAVARAKAKDMATRRYFDHVTPDGIGANHAIRSAGYPLPLWYGTAKSNNTVESLSAGYSSASSAWNALLGSPGHRSHLLATDSFYRDQTTYGIGFYHDDSSPYVDYFVILTAPPRAKSTLTITSPAVDAHVGTESVTFSGTVGGSNIVGTLELRLENSAGSSAWRRVTLPVGSTIGTWSINVAGLTPGANTVRLKSTSAAGTSLAETARTIRWVIMRPLTVALDGGGNVSPGFLGTTNREVGVRYTISAAPNDGSTRFSHWSGLPPGSNSAASRQTFTMVEGLSFTAHFIPNPFWSLRGRYQGILSGQEFSKTGQLRVDVGSSGAFSGKLHYGKSGYAVLGTFDPAGAASLQIKRAIGSPITLSLNLDTTGNSDQITGTVDDSGVLTDFIADRSALPTGNYEPGKLTIRINPDDTVPASPKGSGYAVLNIDELGAVRIAGTLADGRTFTASTIVSKAGTIPLHARFYSNTGAVTGNASLVNTATDDIAGSIRWFKPERLLDPCYPQAFTTQNALTGSRYIQPPAGTPFINFQTQDNRGNLLLAEGNIETQITQPLAVSNDNRVQLQTPTPTGLKLTVNPKNGRFSGNFLHPVAGKRKFAGVVSQKQSAGWGFFRGLDSCGSTVLQPQP